MLAENYSEQLQQKTATTIDVSFNMISMYIYNKPTYQSLVQTVRHPQAVKIDMTTQPDKLFKELQKQIYAIILGRNKSDKTTKC